MCTTTQHHSMAHLLTRLALDLWNESYVAEWDSTRDCQKRQMQPKVNQRLGDFLSLKPKKKMEMIPWIKPLGEIIVGCVIFQRQKLSELGQAVELLDIDKTMIFISLTGTIPILENLDMLFHPSIGIWPERWEVGWWRGKWKNDPLYSKISVHKRIKATLMSHDHRNEKRGEWIPCEQGRHPGDLGTELPFRQHSLWNPGKGIIKYLWRKD